MTSSLVSLDVRPILQAGGEPFDEIMGAVAALRPGEGLRLIASFQPVPLFSVLGARGYAHQARELDGGDWEVLFMPTAVGEAPRVRAATATDHRAAWPEPVQMLDNRDLDPPEPMVRILAAIEAMREGEVLAALLCREPIFLLPELEKRSHDWQGGFASDGKTYKILVRIGSRMAPGT